jgi:hypothetical protein
MYYTPMTAERWLILDYTTYWNNQDHDSCALLSLADYPYEEMSKWLPAWAAQHLPEGASHVTAIVEYHCSDEWCHLRKSCDCGPLDLWADGEVTFTVGRKRATLVVHGVATQIPREAAPKTVVQTPALDDGAAWFDSGRTEPAQDGWATMTVH